METIRVYNAGKIGDLPEAVWLAKFEAARNEIVAMSKSDRSVVAVCPTQLAHKHDRVWLSYMREDITAMLTCDYVYAQRDWADSKGATIEVTTALVLGIPVIYQK